MTDTRRTQTVLALTAEQADRFRKLQERWADTNNTTRTKKLMTPSILVDMMLDALEKDAPSE